MKLFEIVQEALSEPGMRMSFSIANEGDTGVATELDGNEGVLLVFMIMSVLRNGLTKGHVDEAVRLAEIILQVQEAAGAVVE